MLDFWSYGLQKTLLDKFLKSPISDGPPNNNMVNEAKHFSKLNDSPFTIFIGPWEYSWGLKSLSEWYAKS